MTELKAAPCCAYIISFFNDKKNVNKKKICYLVTKG